MYIHIFCLSHHIDNRTNHVGGAAQFLLCRNATSHTLDVSFAISFSLSSHGTSTQYRETSPIQMYRTTPDNPTNNGRGEQRSPAFVHPHGMYKFKPCRSPKRAVEGASPYNYAMVCHAAKSLSLFADFTLCRRTEKAAQSITLRHRFVFIITLHFVFFHSAPLVGLCLLRLCLKLRRGFAP